MGAELPGGINRMKDSEDQIINTMYSTLGDETRRRLDEITGRIVKTKETGGKIAVVTGSGPNIHEGVTTLLAQLIDKSIVDGVITSSAVVAHEMAGSLDRVKRVSGETVGIDHRLLPKGSVFEITLMDDASLATIRKEMLVDMQLIDRAMGAEGEVIIKAAGNMAYPMGLRTERISHEIEALARMTGQSFERIAGLGADERTMIGAGASKGIPVIVSAPQLIGGGAVGLAIGDSISLKQRSQVVARILEEASVIIESGIALSQEVHDGPYETYTGHGIWSAWEGVHTYSLEGKTLLRIDLDPNLEKVWHMERSGGEVQRSVDRGLPKTKVLAVPFRMEMSGFARLEGSIPIVGDLGRVWPILAHRVARSLGITLDFISYPQETEKGKQMRDWIVSVVEILNRKKMMKKVRDLLAASAHSQPQGDAS
jgi:deoxyhypusine synthase